tara:strand:- start:15096 stop:15341 length:246 start_codon:yes stop_codon:yes gene_type:complete
VENQEEIKVLESKEVWYATTKEYDLKIGENKYLVRVAENSNGVEYLILDLDSGEWADLEEGSHGKDGDRIVDALNEGWLED